MFPDQAGKTLQAKVATTSDLSSKTASLTSKTYADARRHAIDETCAAYTGARPGFGRYFCRAGPYNTMPGRASVILP